MAVKELTLTDTRISALKTTDDKPVVLNTPLSTITFNSNNNITTTEVTAFKVKGANVRGSLDPSDDHSNLALLRSSSEKVKKTGISLAQYAAANWQGKLFEVEFIDDSAVTTTYLKDLGPEEGGIKLYPDKNSFIVFNKTEVTTQSIASNSLPEGSIGANPQTTLQRLNDELLVIEAERVVDQALEVMQAIGEAPKQQLEAQTPAEIADEAEAMLRAIASQKDPIINR